MSAAIRLTLLLILACCVVFFIIPPVWLPSGASAQSLAVDHQFSVALWILGIMFAAGQLVLIYVLSQRKRTTGHNQSGSWKLETTWTIAIALIFFWFNISGERLWSMMTHSGSELDHIEVEVTGAQFQWYFRYAGNDGVFGRTNAQKFARAAEGNALGIDPGDPAGRDDIVSTTMVLPVGKNVPLSLHAQDVIHSLFIPSMRFKQDTVPGMVIESHLTPTKIGTYEIACAELCGIGHYRMRALVKVVSEEDFKKWLREQAQDSGN
jgi:cytochrome c oxidase subunit 2